MPTCTVRMMIRSCHAGGVKSEVAAVSNPAILDSIENRVDWPVDHAGRTCISRRPFRRPSRRPATEDAALPWTLRPDEPRLTKATAEARRRWLDEHLAWLKRTCPAFVSETQGATQASAWLHARLLSAAKHAVENHFLGFPDQGHGHGHRQQDQKEHHPLAASVQQ